MKAPSEYADDGFEDEWLERMSPRERHMYHARRPSVPVNGSDLTPSEWREFGRLRALHGDATAHAYHEGIRAARLRAARRAHGVVLHERVSAALVTAVGRGASTLLFVLPATAGFGHAGFVVSASIACVVTSLQACYAFMQGKAA